MRQLVTTAIILSRTDYGEADRILTLLTPDYGKLSLLARGVRKVKSKLAGGIELFSVSTVTYVKGKGELGTLISTRLVKHYGRIVQDLDRTMLGYELIKQLHKITEDEAEAEYFVLLEKAFASLDDPAIPLEMVRLWFWAQLIGLGGRMPNLQSDTAGRKLDAGMLYGFDVEQMSFAPARGRFSADHIKFGRLLFSPQYTPQVLAQVRGGVDFAKDWVPLVQSMTNQYL